MYLTICTFPSVVLYAACVVLHAARNRSASLLLGFHVGGVVDYCRVPMKKAVDYCTVTAVVVSLASGYSWLAYGCGHNMARHTQSQ